MPHLPLNDSLSSPRTLLPRLPRRRTAAALFALAAALLACGPFFPDRILLLSDAEFLSAPSIAFRDEIRTLLPPEASPFHALPPEPYTGFDRQSAAVDLADLRASLAGAPNAADLLARYGHLRDRLCSSPGKPVVLADVPPGLPPQFDLYIRGFILSQSGDVPGAEATFQRLLQLDPADRRLRTVWAAFMLGKLVCRTDPAAAVARFRHVRDLVRDGFPDTLGLASSSLGWEAFAELERGSPARAVELYLEQFASGDPTALESLAVVSGRLLSGDDAALARAADHQPSRRVITAYILARAGRFRTLADGAGSRWLAALERRATPNVAEADRFAWIAYQSGDIDAARRWLSLAAPTGLSTWLQGKLLLRDGRLDEAAQVLARASRMFPVQEQKEGGPVEDFFGDGPPTADRRALGEAAVLLLSRRQYLEALDALLHALYWMDAAYVAERVLTLDELRTYCDRNPPPAAPPDLSRDGADDEPLGDAWDVHTLPDAQRRLRYLLARRLARAGRYDDAAPYMPAVRREDLAALARALREGRDAARPASDRAQSLWNAAELTRYSGLELLGTELAPDGAAFAASYDLADPPAQRERDPGTLAPPDADELARAHANAPAPDRRFHYRYVAADLAWEAAALSPDQDQRTARMLCIAGIWLKAIDPKTADKFYKALVRRCGRTPLGKEADDQRWFPSMHDYQK